MSSEDQFDEKRSDWSSKLATLLFNAGCLKSPQEMHRAWALIEEYAKENPLEPPADPAEAWKG